MMIRMRHGMIQIHTQHDHSSTAQYEITKSPASQAIREGGAVTQAGRQRTVGHWLGMRSEAMAIWEVVAGPKR